MAKNGDRNLAIDTRWSKLTRQDAPEAYVRRVMISTFLTWRRRRWHGEVPVAAVPDRVATNDFATDVDARRMVGDALSQLPARQRAVVVLRYFEDMTEAKAAEALGCSIGTVKSQTTKALARLRSLPELRGMFYEQEVRDDAG